MGGDRLKDAADKINKNLGDRDNIQIVSENEMAGAITEYLHTGNYALDYIISGDATGNGGIPVGRVTEVYGESGSGKSLLLFHLIAEAQKKYEDAVTILADTENSYNNFFGEAMGIDNDRLLYFEPNEVEEIESSVDAALDIASQDDAPLVLYCWDSIGQTSTEHEVGTELGKRDFTKPQLIHSMFRRMGRKHKVSRTRLALVATNHVYSNIGVMFGPKKKTHGGRGYEYASSLRLEVDAKGKIFEDGKKSNNPIGIESEWKITKSRIWFPYRRVRIKQFFAGGYTKHSGLLDILVDEEIINQSGSWYKYDGENFRRSDFEGFVDEHSEILQALTDIKVYDAEKAREIELRVEEGEE